MGRSYIDVAQVIGTSKAVDASLSYLLTQRIVDGLKMPACFKVYVDFDNIDAWSTHFCACSIGVLGLLYPLEELKERLIIGGLSADDKQRLWTVVEKVIDLRRGIDFRALYQEGLIKVATTANDMRLRDVGDGVSSIFAHRMNECFVWLVKHYEE